MADVNPEPIKVAYTLNGLGFPPMNRDPEAATQTFKMGVPLKMNAGFLDEVTFAAADIIWGVSVEEGSNLDVAGTAQNLSEGSPPNQPNAEVIPIGAKIRDGTVGIIQATGGVVFTVVLLSPQVFTQALVIPGTLYGLLKDATSGFFVLDSTDTAGNNAVAEIIGLDTSSPNTAAGGTRVYMRFGSTKRAFA